MASKPTVYWDTCLFLALIKDEVREDPDEMAGLYAVAAEIDGGNINMVTSVVTMTELNVRPLTPEWQTKLDRFLSRENVDVIPLAQHMATMAGHLRAYYAGNPGPKLCQNDAYHLATALVLKVDAFHTFDRSNKKDCLGLLGLDGNVAGFPLRIIKPSTTQGHFGF